MECPKCQKRTGVYGGYSENGKYIRRRKCPSCGYKFITVEKATNIQIQGTAKHGGKREPLNKNQFDVGW